MKRLITFAFFIVISNAVLAQNGTANSNSYKTAVGVKFWDGAGANLKTFIEDKTALEFTGFFWRYGTRITGLYEIHGELNTEGNLKWYIGAGAHVNLYKGYTAGGIDGVIGLDLKLPNAPFDFGLDWQPALELGSGSRNGFYGSWGGFAIRYTL